MRPQLAPRGYWVAGASLMLLLAGGLGVWPVMWFAVEPVEAAKQEKRPVLIWTSGDDPLERC